MSGTKPITTSSSVHQVYGEVPAKICHTLFFKSVDCRKQESAGFARIWGKFASKKRHVHVPHPEKCMKHNAENLCTFGGMGQ